MVLNVSNAIEMPCDYPKGSTRNLDNGAFERALGNSLVRMLVIVIVSIYLAKEECF